MKTKTTTISGRIRDQINDLRDQVIQDLAVILGAEKLLKGSLYRRKLTCGKAGCKCANGVPHDAWFFAYSDEKGKLVQVSLNRDRLSRYRAPAQDYRWFRESRARLAKRQRKLLALCNELERSLTMSPPVQTRKIVRSPRSSAGTPSRRGV